MKITSSKNPHIKDVIKLRASHHRKRQNRFLIEGARCVERAAAAGVTIEQVFLCPDLLRDPETRAVAASVATSGALRYELPAELFATIAYRENPEGLLVVAARPSLTLDSLPTVTGGLYVIAENLEKPGNLGAICRSADAVGVDGLILCDRRTDVFNPNAIRSSTATVFTVPIAEASVEQAVHWLGERGVTLLAATCDDGVDYTTANMTGAVAIAIGSEHDGLSESLIAAADKRVTIAMRGVADSLNASTTCAILLFEAARQRANTARA